jgi:tetratricopeptide (TPR) repeat protein
MLKARNPIVFARIAPLALLVTAIASCGPSTKKGDALYEKGDLEGAAAMYRAAYDRRTTDKVALIKLGRTLYELNTRKMDEKLGVTGAEWKETYELLARGREVEPVPPEVDPIKDFELSNSAYEAGRALAGEGDHREAVKLLAKAKEHGRSGAKVNEYLARSRVEAGDMEGAVDAILEAVEGSTMDNKLVLEGALIAHEKGRLADCHELMLVSEGLEPTGFKYYSFKDIKQMCSRSYFFLTTGLLETIFTTRRLSNERVKEWKDDELLMTKNWVKYQKRRPEEVMKEDKAYFLRILYHLYITHGMAHMLLCDFDRARTWWEDADLFDKDRLEVPSNVKPEVLEDEKTWPKKNIAMLEKLISK